MYYFSNFSLFFLTYCIWGLLLPGFKVEFFFLLVSALLRSVQWFVWESYRVLFVLSFCLFVFPLMGKAEWGSNPVCWWLGLYFCFACCLDEVSCYWWLGDARSCIQVVSFVWVLTIWYSLGLVLWYSRDVESVESGVSLSTPKAQGLISHQEHRFHKWFITALSEIKTNIQKQETKYEPQKNGSYKIRQIIITVME